MALTGVRCTMIFQNGAKAFSETHVYMTSSSLEDALKAFIPLFLARYNLCGLGPVPYAGRMAVLGTQRVTKLLTGPQVEGLLTAQPVGASLGTAAPVGQTDQANACLTAIGSNNSGLKKLIYLTGVPDVLLGTGSPFPLITAGGNWTNAFAAYRTALTGGGFGWIYKTPQDPTQAPFAKIVTFTLNSTSGNVNVISPTLFGSPSAGQQVQIMRVQRSNVAYTSLNGKWYLASVVNNAPNAGQSTYEIAGTSTVAYSAIKNGTGFIGQFSFNTVRYQDVQLDKQGTRKRGNRSLVGPAKRTNRKSISA